MADTYKVLGQSAPLAATLTTLYTVPALTSVIGSTLVIANRGAATTVRVAIRVAGAAIADAQYLAYDLAIAANTTFTLTIGITLATTDVVSVYATLATVSFNLFGVERV
jgi:hypothetical protein